MPLFAYWKGVYEAWIDYPQRSGKLLNGRYRIERFLGMGSYGLTYLCRDLYEGELVVVKQAKPSKKQLSRALLRRESEIMEALKLSFGRYRLHRHHGALQRTRRALYRHGQ